MSKAIARPLSLGLAAMLAVGTAYAQPQPGPGTELEPPDGTAGSAAGSAGSAAGSAAGSGSDTQAPDAGKPMTEKAGANESLQNGGSARPWAVGVPPAQQKAALDLFHQANTLLNDGLFLKASEKYREALKHWNHPAIHYNLALALLNLDQPIQVVESLEQATKFGPAPLEKDKFEHAKEYLVLISQQIADVEVTCEKPGARVQVDGKDVFVGPGTYKGKVRIGKHTFLAQKEGYATGVRAPYIGPGEHYRIELKLYTSDELTRYKRRWQATWFPYAVMGGGVLVGAIGGVLELSARSSYKDYDRQVTACNMNNAGCPVTPELTNLRSSGDTKQTLAYVSYGVGIGALLTGATLAWLNRRQSYQIRAEDLDTEQMQQPHVTLAPLVTPGGAGAMLQGHF